MVVFSFDTTNSFLYRWCGKFQSPSPDWMHLTRPLIDFELIVVTSGTLYIAKDTTKYIVKKGGVSFNESDGLPIRISEI